MGVARFHDGIAIPAMPLALTEARTLDERRQRALVRYYLAAGSGGIATAVHSTQFAIHGTHRHLLRPVLDLVATTVTEESDETVMLIAGAIGNTKTAVEDAVVAADLGYDAVLLAPYGVGEFDDAQLLERAREVSAVLPVIGFALQPAVGGRRHDSSYWRELASIPGVIGIKAAPFDRYATIDIVRGVLESDRRNQVALYTGNDDHIVGDLLGVFGSAADPIHFVGGLLGQWSVWTRNAVRLLDDVKRARKGDQQARTRALHVESSLTDANGAIFDVANGFAGCIPGIHEVLRRHGFLAGTWCLDPRESLSAGQAAEIDRIWNAYPELRDDQFIEANIESWLT